MLRSRVSPVLLSYMSTSEEDPYLPDWRDGNVDTDMSQCASQMLHVPLPRRFPVCGSASDYERSVPGYISHELERTRFFLEHFDDTAVEVIVGVDQVRDVVDSRQVAHGV